jgi:hypothetical protein
MGGRRAVQVALAALVLTASAACNSGSDGDRGTAAANTVRTEPAPTTTTNPYAVPAVIDEAYVNRVLAGLDAALGDITRLVMRTKTIPPEAYDRLKSLYTDPDFLQIKIDGYQRDIRDGFASYKPVPGNKVSTVSQLITAQQSCIFVRVDRDYSNVRISPRAELDTQWVALKPNDVSRDPHRYNPTPWAYVYDGFQQDRSRPPNPCER